MHAALNRLGLEVRLHRNIQGALQLERRLNEAEAWRFLKNHRIDVVLDVGANEGQFARLIRRVCPKSEVWSFEPLPIVFDLLIEQVKSDPRIHPVNLALSDRNGVTQMNLSDFSPSSSLLEMGQLHRDEWPESAQHRSVAVKLARLDDWVTSTGIEIGRGTLLKADVQGHELSVLRGGVETIKAIGVAVLEVEFFELYAGQPLFADIHSMMESLGFRFRGIVEQHCSHKSNKILFADAIFENTRWEERE